MSGCASHNRRAVIVYLFVISADETLSQALPSGLFTLNLDGEVLMRMDSPATAERRILCWMCREPECSW